MNLRWLLGALLAALLLTQPSMSNRVRGLDTAAQAASEITLIVDFGNGTAVTSNALTGESVLQVTESVYTVTVEWYGSLAFVTAIDGVQSTSTAAWQYWVNGVYAAVACNVYEVGDEDVIVWNRTAPSHNTRPADRPIDELVVGAVLTIGFGVAVLVVLYLMALRRS